VWCLWGVVGQDVGEGVPSAYQTDTHTLTGGNYDDIILT